MTAYTRMYYREGRGWYADFRSYAAEGGRLEALKPQGAKRATQDPDLARTLYLRRLDYLQGRREGRIAPPVASLPPVPTLTGYLDRHGALKALDGRARPETIARERVKLERIAAWWQDPRLDTIMAKHFNDLKLRLTGKAAQTVAHYVNAVSSLLQNAVSDGLLVANVAQAVKRPRVTRGEAAWLESHEGHALLVAAAALDADPAYRGVRPLEAIIGTALLTGLRRRELFALLVEDVDFAAGVIHARPNRHYPNRKSRHAIRRVPLWPQLRPLLVGHIGTRKAGLLFTGPGGKPIDYARGSLAAAFTRAEITKPAGKAWHLFRHTYTAMRLQTLDDGAPVSPWTVKAEGGWGSLALLETTYGHLLTERKGQRLDRVEYRPKLGIVAGERTG